ncbi:MULTISPECIES: hypothetical protein [Bacillaceae]|uniref:hypothetical protein n=1 Tax=Bacillaceae TaxID=186817 RepID=UPI000D739BA0|nr:MULTISPECIES: hypothetical protein [Bacillaceae]MCA1203335.1 hypothetical protein [Priestia flexa]
MTLDTKDVRKQVKDMVETFDDSPFHVEHIGEKLAENNRPFSEKGGVITKEIRQAWDNAARDILRDLGKEQVLIENSDGTFSKRGTANISEILYVKRILT